MIGWIVCGWLAGMVVLLAIEANLRRDVALLADVAGVHSVCRYSDQALAAVAHPLPALWEALSDHDALLRHIARDHSPGPVPATEEHR